MKSFFERIRMEVKLFVIFILFVLFFTFLRYPIGDFSAWLLSLTNELQSSDNSDESDSDIYSTMNKTDKLPLE